MPELAKVPSKYIHQPWTMGELELSGFGVVLGKNYPTPVVELSRGRQRALDAFAKLKARRATAGP